MKPLIGINVDIEAGPPRAATVQANYFESLQQAGAIPLLLPPMSKQDLCELLEQLDGVMLIGGYDYCPSLYGETACDKVELTTRERQDFDLTLVRLAVDRADLPLLGICAGCQLLNIALGGSLIQDIPSHLPASPVEHSSHNGWQDGFARHTVRVEPGSKLGKIFGQQPVSVPTSHHQAVKDLGSGLRSVAFAEDGIIEAVELADRPFAIGVQWHPERDFPGNQRLFTEFVAQSAHIRKARKGQYR